MNGIPEPVAERIWAILIETCRAYPPEFPEFADYVARPDATEYRFIGSLGFGGKFYIPRGWRVDCYPEDRTPERLTTITTANEQLAELEIDLLTGTRTDG